MRKLLDEGNIVIAAGFQGIDEDFNITTLGRGGSDTTAVALAAVLRADACEIYTDVDGVYTTDPRVLPEARRVQQHQLRRNARAGQPGRGRDAQPLDRVRQEVRRADPRAQQLHRHARHDDRRRAGSARPAGERRGAGQGRSPRSRSQGVPDRPGTSLAIFSKIAARRHRGRHDRAERRRGGAGEHFVHRARRTNCRPRSKRRRKPPRELGAKGVTHDDDVAKVSVVGLGMARQTGVAEKMFRALADAGVNILMITTSEIKISVLVRREQAQMALRVVHQAFRTGSRAARRRHGAPPSHATAATATTPLDVVRRLQGMEDLTIDDISLDESQARVTIHGVPDKPGIAAEVFEEVARGGRLRRHDRAKLRRRADGRRSASRCRKASWPRACRWPSGWPSNLAAAA